MHPVIAFQSYSPSHQFLSNFYACALIFAGFHLPFGSEQAYVLSKALLVVPRANNRDKRRDDEVNRVLHAGSALDCKRISRQIRNMSCTPYCCINLRKIPHLRAQLIATGDALLVEANQGDKVWGCGMSYDQVMQAVRHSEAQNKQWNHGPNTNRLGKLLMRVRSQLQMHQPTNGKLFIGGSLGRHATLNCTAVTWPGADLNHVINLANILGNQTIKDIIICAGTNSLPRAAPWEGSKRTTQTFIYTSWKSRSDGVTPLNGAPPTLLLKCGDFKTPSHK